MMSKRKTDTSIWEEDWFINLPCQYQVMWFYIKDKCDFAGFWKPNITPLYSIIGNDIDLNTFYALCNEDKRRIYEVEDGTWLLCGYYLFHYGRVLSSDTRLGNKCLSKYRRLHVPLNYLGDIQIDEEDKYVNPGELYNININNIPEEITPFNNLSKHIGRQLGLSEKEIEKFVDYWEEKNLRGKLCRWQKQQTFDIKKRLLTWQRNSYEWNKGNKKLAISSSPANEGDHYKETL